MIIFVLQGRKPSNAISLNQTEFFVEPTVSHNAQLGRNLKDLMCIKQAF